MSTSKTVKGMPFKEYWQDWYWNRGGRAKVLNSRYIAEYKRKRALEKNKDETQ